MSVQFNARKALDVLQDNESEGATREKLKTLNQLSTITNVNIIPLEVIQQVVLILEETENRMIINSILSSVQHMAQFERTRMLIGENTDCIRLLVPHMSQFNFPNIQCGALDAMSELIKTHKKNQETLIQFASEFFNPLLGIIQRENESVTRKAISVLDALFENPTCLHVIFGDKDRFDEYLEPLVICLQMETNRQVMQWALTSVEYACRQNPLYAKHLMDIGVIDPLVQVVLDPKQNAFPLIRTLALRTLISCVKYSNEGGQWAGDSGLVSALIEIMYSTSLELNSKNITQSYAHSIETQELREAAFEVMMYMTNFIPGNTHTRFVSSAVPQTVIVSGDITQDGSNIVSIEDNNSTKKDKKLTTPRNPLRPYYDESEENPEEIDVLAENKQNITNHADGLNVLFAYIGQAAPSEKAELGLKKHIGNVRKMAIKVIANICTIPENGLIVLERQQQLLSFENAMNIVDLLLDILINKKADKETSERAKRREVGQEKLDIKQCIIDAMGSFALHDVCIQKLGEMGVIKRLLKMIDDRKEAAEVAKLLAKMCEHSGFQKVMFEEGGLARVIKLLEAQDNPEDRLAGLMVCLPLSSNPNGCVALSRDGIDKRVRDISKREVVFEEVRKLAKQVIKVFKETNKSSLRSTKAAVGQTDETGNKLGINVFKFNYEEVARVDSDFVEVCQKRLRDLLKQQRFRLQVNWRQVERLGDINFADEAISILARQDLYEELVMAVEAFIDAAEMNIHTFNSQVPLIVLEVLPPKRKQSTTEKDPKKGEEEEDEAVPCELEIGDLIMKYKLSPDGIWWTPKQLAGLISYELLGYDIIETNEMLIGDGEEDRDDQYELGIEQLKKTCKDSRLAMLGDINILYFHIEITDLLWKYSFAESQQLVAAKTVISPDELFLKGWRIVKLNKDGMAQERILLLTNSSYYTVSFDPKAKKIDFKHTKHHNLEDYFLCDVGKLVKSRHDTTNSSVHLHEDGKNKYALNLVTNEKPHTSKALTKIEEEAEELEKMKRISLTASLASARSSSSSNLFSSSDGKSSNSGGDDTEEDLSSQAEEDDVVTETFKNESALMKGISLEEELIDIPERPSTTGKYSSIFTCPESVPRNKQKYYLQEIAWCFRAAASAARRAECHDVYERDIVKPIEGKLARFYNITGMGKKKDNSFIAKHMESKMRKEQEKQEDRVKKAQDKGLRNIKGDKQ